MSSWRISVRAPLLLVFLMPATGCAVSDTPTRGETSTASYETSPGLTQGEFGDPPVAMQIPMISPQPVSDFPVDKEWREFVTAFEELDRLANDSYREWHRRIAACMKARGFGYVQPIPVDEMKMDFNRAINPLNSEAANSWGYHLPRTAEVENLNDLTAPGFAEALDGGPDTQGSGCASMSAGQAYAPTNDLFQSAQALANALDEATAGFENTDDGRAMLAEWRSCMEAGGLQYSSRGDPYEAFGGSPAITEDEIRTRRLDLACDEESGLTKTRSAWQRQQFEAWLSSSASALGELSSMTAAADQALIDLASENL